MTKVHPAAELFPLLTDEQLAALVDSMRGGFDATKPILLYQGQILDGRNRLRAAELAGVEPVYAEAPQDADPYAESWKHNGARRDLEPGQRAAIRRLVELHSADWQAELAVKREAANVARGAKLRGTPRADRAASQEAALSVRPVRTADSTAANAGVSRATVERVRMVAGDDRSRLQQIATGAVKLHDAVREHKRAAIVAKLSNVAAQETKAASGVYDVLVIDPPWDMKKIERDTRPNQSELDYPTLGEAELASLRLPCADDCHVWVWTTHRFLPMALRLLVAWELKYVCTFVWHKPGGFQPMGLPQFNCEFAVYARRGTPQFVDTKAFPVCFSAPRGAHSEKPAAFYDSVRRVTAGRRLDMFNRRPIDGFDTWGNEAK